MASIFTKIINKELPAYRICEDEQVIAFLALDQIHLGHTLVVPKQEVNHWFDVPEKDYVAVQLQAQRIARAMKAATGCPRVGVMVAGFEVPHYHVHLIPAWSIPDLDFKKASRRSDADMKEIQSKIIAALGQ